MKHVYLLQSTSTPDQSYIGITANMNKRLAAHNAGQSPHTSRFRPWEIVVCVSFRDDDKARKFEKHLKSGSGRAFAAKHF